ncbi:hypothetical protein SAMN04489764_4057 [Thermostaphylospora chromogena]|uniref:Uncharacterized protein n=1 Tax=Thermostaphylospora chromogena TaxID=35622 RepID=A0A1H1H5N0_9ACTN|nr:hypothetical protein SAMN04489764_4057 [Thermostaphylospora chromogena]
MRNACYTGSVRVQQEQEREEAGAGEDGFQAVRAVADAILYEGYLLYPYRRSSVKNRVRWQFGVLVPRPWAQARGLTGGGVTGAAESWWQQTECLLLTDHHADGAKGADGDASVECLIRFLHTRRRSVERRLPDGGWERVDSLQAGSRLELSFDDAVMRELRITATLAELLAGERRIDLTVPGGRTCDESLGEARGPAGRVVVDWKPIAVTVFVSASACPARHPLVRLRVRVENADLSVSPDVPREEALRVSPVACHTLLAARGARFVSLLDPPDWAQAAVRGCENVHTFPVLAGDPQTPKMMLSSPILLYDHPRVAPESPGDLHDATEIDELLSLRTLTLTDAEKEEARATDPRAAAIVDRVETMPREVLARLHGTIRSLRPAPMPQARRLPPDDGDGVLIGGVRVARGSRVRLRPRRTGTDPQDLFLEGRTALVEAVLTDMEGGRQLAVTLEDDPGAELGRWYGRFRYFLPDEVEPVTDAAGSDGAADGR